MSDDGRLLTLLALGGLAATAVARGSRSFVRRGRGSDVEQEILDHFDKDAWPVSAATLSREAPCRRDLMGEQGSLVFEITEGGWGEMFPGRPFDVTLRAACESNAGGGRSTNSTQIRSDDSLFPGPLKAALSSEERQLWSERDTLHVDLATAARFVSALKQDGFRWRERGSPNWSHIPGPYARPGALASFNRGKPPGSRSYVRKGRGQAVSAGAQVASRIRSLTEGLTEAARSAPSTPSGSLPSRGELIDHVWHRAVRRIPVARFPEFVRKLEDEAVQLVAPGWGKLRKGILTEKAVAQYGEGNPPALDGFRHWPSECKRDFVHAVAVRSLPKTPELLEDGLAVYVFPFTDAEDIAALEVFATDVAAGGWI
jgi:hypothetical protein